MDGLERLLQSADESLWGTTLDRLCQVREIRLQGGMPVILQTSYGEIFLGEDGKWTPFGEKAVCYDKEQFRRLCEILCRDSVYAFERELGLGYLTLDGGHRVGVAGKLRVSETGQIIGMKQILSLNIRVSHFVEYDISTILSGLEAGKRLPNILLISSPGAGKTTCLRSLISALSEGTENRKGIRVGVVDERGELYRTAAEGAEASMGLRTDVMIDCKKAVGMQMLIRSMNPDVIAVDEIGAKEDFFAVREAARCGVSVIATMHAGSLLEARRRLQEWGENLESCFNQVFLLTALRSGGENGAFKYEAREVWRDISDTGNYFSYDRLPGNRVGKGKEP